MGSQRVICTAPGGRRILYNVVHRYYNRTQTVIFSLLTGYIRSDGFRGKSFRLQLYVQYSQFDLFQQLL